MVRSSTGSRVSRAGLGLAFVLLTACGSPGPDSTPQPLVPGDFHAVRDWSGAERALRIARWEGRQYLIRTCPDAPRDERATWWTTPARVMRRHTPDGSDWWFRFETPTGHWVELIVLAVGGIEGLDAGPRP